MFLLLLFLFLLTQKTDAFQLADRNLRRSNVLKVEGGILSADESNVITDEKVIQTNNNDDEDTIFREFAFRIASTFPARDFKPASSLLANRHVQTISGAFLREDANCRYTTLSESSQNYNNDKANGNAQIPLWQDPGIATLASSIHRNFVFQSRSSNVDDPSTGALQYWDEREEFQTPDDDFFHVDYKYVHQHRNRNRNRNQQMQDKASPLSSAAKGLVIVVHGLQSNSNSSLVRDIATACRNQGFDVAAINFRGCSGVPNNGLKAYHLGFTDDLKQFLAVLKSRQQNSPDKTPIFITGKSLGANVVLKALGELGMSAYTDYNVHGAAVCCCPFDNQRNANFLLRGFSKVAYNGNLLKSLKEVAYRQVERLGMESTDAQKIDYDKLQKATRITEFDEAFIAPLFGFKDHLDYYNKTSCLNFLDKIRVPTLILNSKDDPFMDPDFFPRDFGCISLAGRQAKSSIQMVRTNHGGHLGYMFHQINSNDKDNNQDVSFMPFELSRFINHVFERRTFLEGGEVARQYFQINQVGTFSDMVDS